MFKNDLQHFFLILLGFVVVAKLLKTYKTFTDPQFYRRKSKFDNFLKLDVQMNQRVDFYNNIHIVEGHTAQLALFLYFVFVGLGGGLLAWTIVLTLVQ